MTRNVSYQNPIHAEENTPVVTILETKIDDKQSFAIDSRGARYVIDLSKASFGGIAYPIPGSQWYLKKISGVWALMARAPQQNPQLDPSITPSPGDVILGFEGTTFVKPPITAITDTTTDNAFVSKVSGDTNLRWAVRGDGKHLWGSGSGASDTDLYRVAAGTLETTGAIRSTRPTAGDGSFATIVTGDPTTNRFLVTADGGHSWGPGNASRDTTLYRVGVGSLKTDGDFTAAKGRFGGSSGDAVFVGDDAKLVDINLSDVMGVQSQTNPGLGGFYFGNGLDTNIYRATTSTLKTDGTFNAVTDVQRNGSTLPRGQFGYARRTAAKSGVTTESAALRINITLPAGRLFVFISDFLVSSTVNEIAYYFVRLRQDTSGSNATTASTQVAVVPGTTFSGSGVGHGQHINTRFATGGSPVTMSMVITVARIVGTGTLSIQDGDGGNIAIWCDDLGPYNSTNLGTDL